VSSYPGALVPSISLERWCHTVDDVDEVAEHAGDRQSRPKAKS